MRQETVAAVKQEIRELLNTYIRGNGDTSNGDGPIVEVEGIEGRSVEGTLLLWELRVVLEVLGKPWRCDMLVNTIFKTMQAYHLSHRELHVVMMSLHVEARALARTHTSNLATIRCIFEDTDQGLERLEAAS